MAASPRIPVERLIRSDRPNRAPHTGYGPSRLIPRLVPEPGSVSRLVYASCTEVNSLRNRSLPSQAAFETWRAKIRIGILQPFLDGVRKMDAVGTNDFPTPNP